MDRIDDVPTALADPVGDAPESRLQTMVRAALDGCVDADGRRAVGVAVLSAWADAFGSVELHACGSHRGSHRPSLLWRSGAPTELRAHDLVMAARRRVPTVVREDAVVVPLPDADGRPGLALTVCGSSTTLAAVATRAADVARHRHHLAALAN